MQKVFYYHPDCEETRYNVSDYQWRVLFGLPQDLDLGVRFWRAYLNADERYEKKFADKWGQSLLMVAARYHPPRIENLNF